MPYVDDEAKEELEPILQVLAEEVRRFAEKKGGGPEFAGYLNYCCTELALHVLPKVRYWPLALIHGVLADIYDEIRRRITNDYEDDCIAKNGDIPSFVRLARPRPREGEILLSSTHLDKGFPPSPSAPLPPSYEERGR